ncbi:hypothetical protein [uncultured Clostridium sp.]|uniref:hypothetical protein n=1 Tax=uncultured Clostridium sp. TaxID=59620 RepID=UPI000EE7B75A|nr:hypothetical protein [uncultured Clostridium sp.]HAB67013.1 hypothetical protein [Bacillota bacterium]
MNEKEKSDLKHYKYLIENRKFDEYDIVGFLVLIREHIDMNKNPIFHDFADGTAHRKRNQGIIYDCMYDAELNCYNLDDKGNIISVKTDINGNPVLFSKTVDNKIGGYSGLEYIRWEEECNHISSQFDIKITPIIAKELLLCMFSIFHRALIETDNKSKRKAVSIKGSIELLSGPNNSISLLTSDDNKKYTACFMKIADVTVLKTDFLMEAVETFRKNGMLYLKEKDEIILKVSKSRKQKC